MINGQYVAKIGDDLLVVKMRDRKIVDVQKPDGYHYAPTNSRHIRRLKMQAPPDTPDEDRLFRLQKKLGIKER